MPTSISRMSTARQLSTIQDSMVLQKPSSHYMNRTPMSTFWIATAKQHFIEPSQVVRKRLLNSFLIEIQILAFRMNGRRCFAM